METLLSSSGLSSNSKHNKNHKKHNLKSQSQVKALESATTKINKNGDATHVPFWMGLAEVNAVCAEIRDSHTKRSKPMKMILLKKNNKVFQSSELLSCDVYNELDSYIPFLMITEYKISFLLMKELQQSALFFDLPVEISPFPEDVLALRPW